MSIYEHFLLWAVIITMIALIIDTRRMAQYKIYAMAESLKSLTGALVALTKVEELQSQRLSQIENLQKDDGK